MGREFRRGLCQRELRWKGKLEVELRYAGRFFEVDGRGSRCREEEAGFAESRSGDFLHCRLHGGEGGIRTPGTLSGTPVFKTGAINHSATSPAGFRRP